MKNFKQMINIAFITFSILINLNVMAQQKSKSTLSGFSVEIPEGMKITTAEKSNNTLIRVSKYDSELGGTIYVSGLVNSEGKVKFDSVLVPNENSTRMDANCTGGDYRACALGCTDKPTNAGVILCTAYCMISCPRR